jgi:hypothetical protein
MSYVDPCAVVSPKHRIKDVEIAYDSGPIEGSWAVAKFLWDSKDRIGVDGMGNRVRALARPRPEASPRGLCFRKT